MTWTLTREFQDPAAPGRRETLTTRVAMNVVLKLVQSRGGVRLYQAEGGEWTASGGGTAEETSPDCTLARQTDIGLHGRFGPPANVVTLLQNQTSHRGLLNFSVSQGEGAVRATTRYCDGRTVAKDTTYFWGIADAGVDVSVETGPGGPKYIVSKTQSGPCGTGATCTRTASGVLETRPAA